METEKHAQANMQNILISKGVYGEAEYRGEYGDYMTAPLGNYDAPEGWPTKPYKRPYGGTPGPPVMYEKPSNPEDEGAGYGFESSGAKEKEVYLYHPDHLGSTSYITDKDGNVTIVVCSCDCLYVFAVVKG